MAVEQIRLDRRTEQWLGSGRKILMPAQGLRFFSESLTGSPMLLFQYHATSEMRGCLRVGMHPVVQQGGILLYGFERPAPIALSIGTHGQLANEVVQPRRLDW